MNTTRAVLLLALPTLLPGCNRHHSISQSLRVVLQQVAAIDVNVNHFPSYPEYHENVEKQVEAAIAQLTSATDLNGLFLECHRRWRAAPEAPQDKLQWCDSNYEACNAILFRLAKLGSEEATTALVRLYADQTLGWDGEFSLNAAHAISRCGKRAVPYVKSTNFRERNYLKQQILDCIEKGELYGP